MTGIETESALAGAIAITDSPGSTLYRSGRFVWAKLKKPHLTLSTSQVNGGQRENLQYLVNHQSCEGKGHSGRNHDLAVSSPREYHEAVCEEVGLPPGLTALMGTAANMQNMAFAMRDFEEVSVRVAVTAGVQGNAGRAGDPVQWHEGADGWKPIHAQPGTINTLVLFDWPLVPAALLRAVATMTEAKTAVLQELGVSSRYTPLPATGTGTDQFGLASPLDAGRKPKTWTGKHCKLGEILALAVMDATREALRWQNGLEPSRTRNLAHALGRHGVTEASLLAAMRSHLSVQESALLEANFLGVLHEPQVAGAAYAMSAVQERVSYGVLPPAAARELLVNQGALMASALSAKPERFPEFRSALSGSAPGDNPAIFPLVARALALGWSEKWR